MFSILFLSLFTVSSDTTRVVIYREHELTYETDTVTSVFNIQSGSKWYIKTPNGEAWSDRPPIILDTVNAK